MILRPYQTAGVEFAERTGRCIIADEMGMGKSIQAIVASDHEGSHLVVCPSHLKNMWQEEFDKHAKRLNQTIHILTNSNRQDQIAEYSSLIVSWEQLRIEQERLAKRWDYLIVDEGHRAKDRKTKQSKAFMEIAKVSDKVFILTGTPIVTEATDLWPLLHAINPKEFPSYWGFRNAFVEESVDWFGHRKAVGIKNADKLRARLEPVMIRRFKKDHLLELPDKIESVIRIDMTPKQRKAYKQMAKDMEVDFENHKVIAPLGITQYTRCEQLAFGTSLLDESDESGKADAVEQFVLDELPHKTVVVCNYRASVDCLVRRLSKTLPDGSVVSIMGGMKDEDKRIAEKNFVQNPQCKVLVATLKSISEGYTFVSQSEESRSSLMVLCGIPDTPKDYDQVSDRLHRIGQNDSVRIIMLLSKATVEEAAVDRLGLRGSMCRTVMGNNEQVRQQDCSSL